MPSVVASTTSTPSTLAQPTVRGAITPPGEKCLLDMPVPVTPTMEASHRPAARAADTPTPATRVAADTPLHLFVANPTQDYEGYMGYGMRMQRARNATMDDDNHRRRRWQHIVIISTSASGGHRNLP